MAKYCIQINIKTLQNLNDCLVAGIEHLAVCDCYKFFPVILRIVEQAFSVEYS